MGTSHHYNGMPASLPARIHMKFSVKPTTVGSYKDSGASEVLTYHDKEIHGGILEEEGPASELLAVIAHAQADMHTVCNFTL